MPDTRAETLSDEQLKKLRDAGWRQGALLRATEDVLSRCAGLTASDVLVVCTQSCSLLNPSLTKFPQVELVAVSRLSDGVFRAKSDYARGKVVSELHLPLEQPATGAISMDLNRRYFVPRSLLLTCALADERMSAQSATALAAWIARSYTRVALPDELVSRLSDLLKQIEKVLRKKSSSGALFYEQVKEIFVRWSPDSELGDGEEYEFDLRILCEDVEIERELDVLLPNTESGPAISVIGVNASCEVVVRGEALLTYLDGFKRFSDWDHFTSLGEIAVAIDREGISD